MITPIFAAGRDSSFSGLKILQLVQTLDVRTGGVASAVLLLSEALRKAGQEVEIVTLDAPEADCVRRAAFKVHSLGRGAAGYGYTRELLPWLQRNGDAYDRVIVNGLWQYPSLAAWRRYAGSDRPYYVFPHGMLDPWFKRTYPLKHLKKWLYWPWADYRVLRDARAVIFTSEEECRKARESFWLYRCREEICPLGVPAPPLVSADEFLTRFPEVRGKRIILFLGRLHPKKGGDLLLEAFSKTVPNDSSVMLVMAGPDQWNGELQKRAGSGVLFTGMLEGTMKWSALHAAEAFILPSHQENFGLSVVEAMASNRPVLISNRVDIWREVLADGAGFVENDDARGTERLLTRWLGLSEAERRDMQKRAGECFRRRFEIEHAAALLLKILA